MMRWARRVAAREFPRWEKLSNSSLQTVMAQPDKSSGVEDYEVQVCWSCSVRCSEDKSAFVKVKPQLTDSSFSGQTQLGAHDSVTSSQTLTFGGSAHLAAAVAKKRRQSSHTARSPRSLSSQSSKPKSSLLSSFTSCRLFTSHHQIAKFNFSKVWPSSSFLFF